uniref:Uncharacterized protein n=1 Tax=Rhizophora mucronata TaxID=61149 RepID=A0A2P2NML5_RHIMU
MSTSNPRMKCTYAFTRFSPKACKRGYCGINLWLNGQLNMI